MTNRDTIGDVHADTGSVAVGLAYNSIIQIINSQGSALSAEKIKEHEARYLKRVISECVRLDWLEQIEFTDNITPELDSLYIPQYVIEYRNFHQKDNNKPDPLFALEALNNENRLILTGTAGSGKSAFVNFITACFCGELLNSRNNNLQKLTKLPKEFKKESINKPNKIIINWNHGQLVPVKIVLRDFATSNSFPKKEENGDAGNILNYLKCVLINWGCADYYEILVARLQEGSILLLLDGLDEIPEAGNYRDQLINCIRGFSRTYENTRILVTCRPYAYQQKKWKLEKFTSATIAEFNRDQILYFIDLWYKQQNLDDTDAESKAYKFKRAILSNQSLFNLAKRPLMLSLTAFLHSKNHNLPERRTDLYEHLIELLIDKWEKSHRRESSKTKLTDLLEIDHSNILKILERLAFHAHAKQQEYIGTADIPVKELINELVYAAQDHNGKIVNPRELCTYLRDRVGILHQRSEEDGRNAIYAFPHRSFQEYLAATYFLSEEKELFDYFSDENITYRYWPELLAKLVRTEPDRWKEVTLLAAGKQIKTTPHATWDLISLLCPKDLNKNQETSELLHGLQVAGEILSENTEYPPLNSKHTEIFSRVISNLPIILRSSSVIASERYETGKQLSIIGDPRKEVINIDELIFCMVSAGEFLTKEKNINDNSTNDISFIEKNLEYTYWMSKYPITVSQFKEFLEKSNYIPNDSDCLKNYLTFPVTDVTWYDAMNFCQWLSEHYKKNGWIPQDWRITLPNSDEWEKAARGGLYIPSQPKLKSIPELLAHHFSDPHNSNEIINDNPKRDYPFNNEIDSEKSNYNMMIGSTSTPGMYPSGKSVYGCEDLIGNIFEWTSSIKDNPPYSNSRISNIEMLNLIRKNHNVNCLLYGGAFFSSPKDTRITKTHSSHPSDRNLGIGFRVVLTPFL